MALETLAHSPGGRIDAEGEDFVIEPRIVGTLDKQRGGVDDNSAQAGHIIVT
jgi:hypothetical protein